MLYVVRYSFLLISICIRSMSLAATVVPGILIKSSGHDVIIECTTDKSPQDGVYMYKQGESLQTLFYFYKENNLTLKTANKSKVRVSGKLLKLSVTLLHVTAEDIGLYWCEFNLEEKNTVGKFTWLWIEKEKEQDCPEDALPIVKIIFIVCAVMLLLFISVLCCMILKKCCWGNKNYTPSNPPLESVYEDMKRSNLNAQPSVQTFINPDYQSSKQLR